MWKKLLICGATALLVGCGAGSGTVGEVRLGKVAKADLTLRYVASGRVRSRTVRVSSSESAFIQAVLVEANQPVKKGQLLAQLAEEDVRQSIRQLEAQLDSAQSRANEASALLSVRTSQANLEVQRSVQAEAEASSVVAQNEHGATTEERQQQREKLRQAEEKLRSAQRDLARQKELFAQDIVSKAQLESAESQVKVNQSAYREALAGWNLTTRGTRPEVLQQMRLKRDQASLNAALAREKGAEEQVQVNRVRTANAEVNRILAELEYARYRLNQRRIVSPVDGVVSQLLFEPGESVGMHAPMMTVVTHGPYWVEAEVDEQDAVHVRPAQVVKVRLTSLPGKALAGKVTEVAPSLEARPQGPPDHKMLRIKVALLEKPPELRAGLEADVEGTVVLAKDVLSVPRSALRREGGEDFVLTVQQGKLQKNPLKLGAVSNERAEVREGLAPGSEVVIEGGEGLAVGSPVRLTP